MIRDAIKGKGGKARVVGVLFVTVGIVGLIYGYRWYNRSMDSHYTSNCANHFIQLYLTLELIAQDHPDFRLPETNDTRRALLSISTSLTQDFFSERLLYGGGTACPQSFKRDGSIGYVYVGDGLRLGNVVESNILVLFCPAENHRRSQEHSHAWRIGEMGSCISSNAGMIAELERAITEGKSGKVRYSTRAMDVLRHELAKRQKQ